MKPLHNHSICSRVIIALVISASSSLAFSKGEKPSTEEAKVVSLVISQFQNKTLFECIHMIDRLRPEAVNDKEKQILRSAGFPLISKETEVIDPIAVANLYYKTRKVLQFHHREGVVEYIIFRNSDPVVMTKAGAYIAISTRALEIASDDEALSGVIAHELSHEYFAREFLDAYTNKNLEKLRKIELLCDAIATITLIAVKIKPDKYAKALKRIARNSKESERLNDGTNGMPTIAARLQVIAKIKKMFAR